MRTSVLHLKMTELNHIRGFTLILSHVFFSSFVLSSCVTSLVNSSQAYGRYWWTWQFQISVLVWFISIFPPQGKGRSRRYCNTGPTRGRTEASLQFPPVPKNQLISKYPIGYVSEIKLIRTDIYFIVTKARIIIVLHDFDQHVPS